MLPKPCRGCGRPGKSLCDDCRKANVKPVNPAYHDKEYLGNRQIMIADAWRRGLPCWLCGLPFMTRSDITCDHIKTLRDGGTHELANLAPAHDRCNKGRFQRSRRKQEKPAPVVDQLKDNNSYLEWLPDT